MSSHFNYEIEERNMRNQLKELEVPFKEEAWQNYEVFAKQFQSTHKKQLLPNFNFALNRTVVLPVVFGGIIILFSFLLFNFINIKNSNLSKTQASAIVPNVIPTTSEKPKPSPKKQPTVTVTEKIVPIKQNEIASTITTAAVPSTASIAAKSAQKTVTTEAAVTTTVSQEPQVVKSTPVNSFEPKKKRRKKGSAEVLESIATPVSLPSVAQEEAEPELK